jgi:hypothetical protein
MSVSGLRMVVEEGVQSGQAAGMPDDANLAGFIVCKGFFHTMAGTVLQAAQAG